MGALVGSACGWVGTYLLLRRMALIGDAISHSVLPGIVGAFFLTRHTSTAAMFAGAIAAGFATVALVEFIQKKSRIKADAAICVVFTTLFALGVLMVQSLNTHLDVDCVLFGEIAFVPLEPPAMLWGHALGPPSVVRMAALAAVLLGLIVFFYKELLITSFDAGISKAMGLSPGAWHYGLMAALSLAVVSSFESVGAIMAVAMLIVPAMFGAQLSSRLPWRLALSSAHAAASSVLGFHLAVWLNCSTAGAMVVAGSFLFLCAWGGTALAQRWHRAKATSHAMRT